MDDACEDDDGFFKAKVLHGFPHAFPCSRCLIVLLSFRLGLPKGLLIFLGRRDAERIRCTKGEQMTLKKNNEEGPH